jgi:hypothetical protein
VQFVETGTGCCWHGRWMHSWSCALRVDIASVDAAVCHHHRPRGWPVLRTERPRARYSARQRRATHGPASGRGETSVGLDHALMAGHADACACASPVRSARRTGLPLRPAANDLLFVKSGGELHDDFRRVGGRCRARRSADDAAAASSICRRGRGHNQGRVGACAALPPDSARARRR